MKQDYSKPYTFSHCKDASRMSTSRLSRELYFASRVIKRTYSLTLAMIDRTGMSSLPASIEWLRDNYYIISREIKEIRKTLSYVKSLPAVRTVKGKEIRILSCLSELVEDRNANITSEDIRQYLHAVQEVRELDNTELTLLRPFLSACCIRIIRRVCDNIVNYLRTGQTDVSELGGELFGSCVKLLRFNESYDFEDIYTDVSGVEKILERDPTGAYAKLDKPTKAHYRRRLSELANREGKSEAVIARRLLEDAQRYGSMLTQSKDNPEIYRRSHIGYKLLEKKRRGTFYFTTLMLIVALLSVFAVFTTGWMTLLLIFPIYELAKQVADFIFAHSVDTSPIPKVHIEKVPENARTLVCITTLLTGRDDHLFERLEKIYHCNKDENIRFAILGDLKDAADITAAGDDEILDSARQHIESFNFKYGGGFCLFVRRRSYSAGERRFMGWERKRGAVIELVRFIKGMDTTIDTFIGDESFIKSSKYVITLDADTNLGIDDARQLIGAMLHPSARPVLDEKKGIVTSGYAIMQPRMGVELASSSKTTFTRFMSGCGGMDIYSSAAFDLYQELFSEGIFCGKGIFDADMFYKALDKAYPEDSVLSHDLLEGTRLRACLVSDMELTDSIPKNPLSYFDRLHRWIRGDIQALSFAFGYVKDTEGRKVRNPINALSKYKLYDNARRALLPVFTLLALILAPLSGQAALASGCIALLYILFPAIMGVLTILTQSSYQNIARRFSSKVMTSIWQTFMGALFELSCLAYKVQLSLDASLRSVWRMVFTRRRMLNWVTAGQADMHAKGMPLYLLRMLPSVLIGVLFLLFVPFGFYKVLGVLWIVFPFAAYYSGKEAKGSDRQTSAREKQLLTKYASDMWKYYEENVNSDSSHLPPDNVQLFPVENTAYRTSPTNIGVYLLSVLAARDFGLLSTLEMCSRLDATLSVLEGINKWNGHLYNWYDLKSMEAIGGRFVSTVDSGNLATALVALGEGIKEYSGDSTSVIALVDRIKSLQEGMDFSALYNKKRELFYIGYDEASGAYSENCYDLFMSEAVATSYYAVARREVPKKHWTRLSRTLIKHNGYMGLASWTGTTFEYFMPALLLPVYRHSLIYEAYRFAFRQILRKKAGSGEGSVWGISESGFFAFDGEMNYQYKAFGLQKLGLKRGLDKELVISPYSTFLAMCVSPSRALRNLSRLRKMGMYGKYGFYEALDFTPQRVGNIPAHIKSYMAHHVGMSIISCANACFDGIFRTRYMSDRVQLSANELLQEKIPVDAVIFDDIYRNNGPDKHARPLSSKEELELSSSCDVPDYAVLSNTRCSAVLSGKGVVLLSDGQSALNYQSFENGGDCLRPFAFMFDYNGDVYSPSSVLCRQEGTDYTFMSGPGFAVHNMSRLEHSGGGDEVLFASARYTLHPELSCFTVNLEISMPEEHDYPDSVMLYFEPIISSLRDYNAHPAFSALSLECFYDEGRDILLYRRRARLPERREKWMGIALQSGSFSFASRRDDALPQAYSVSDIERLVFAQLDNAQGACINPLCAIRFPLTELEKKKRGQKIFIASASTREQLEQIIDEVRLQGTENSEKRFTEDTLNRMSSVGLTQTQAPVLRRIINSIYTPRDIVTQGAEGLHAPQELLWSDGISGDLPIVVCEVNKVMEAEELSAYVRCHKYLVMNGVRFDLVFIYTEGDKYSRRERGALEEMLDRERVTHRRSKGGGIFMVEKSLEKQTQYLLLRAAASLYVSESVVWSAGEDKAACPSGDILRRVCDGPEDRHYSPAPPDLTVRGGYFSGSSFVVQKPGQNAPWSHILTGRRFGTLLTHSSLGFTWLYNASQMRLTPWYNDSCSQKSGEHIILSLEGVLYDLAAVSDKVSYSPGVAEYYGCAGDIEYKLSVWTAPKLFVKNILLQYINRASSSLTFEVSYRVQPVMGEGNGALSLIETGISMPGAVSMRSISGKDMKDYNAFLYSSGGKSRLWRDCAEVSRQVSLSAGEEESALFSLGCGKSKESVDMLLSSCNEDNALRGIQEAKAFAFSLLPKIGLSSPDKYLDVMFNTWLPYQNITARFLARTGFYQSSGAFGFRDQLQDSVALCYSAPHLTRTHIIRACRHQFVQGDVQHWWHNISSGKDYGHRGVRTRCSDDYLWLVYTVCRYIEITGDYSVLDVRVQYIISAPLVQGEHERYEIPRNSGEYGSVYEHCVRAADYVQHLGSHGIPLIGTCDWNDGFSLVGRDGRGESVWLAWFAVMVLERFAPLCAFQGDTQTADKYKSVCEALRDAIEENCFDEGWYVRGFYDDGTKLGASENDECRIDILPQAFAALVPGRDRERIKISLENAYNQLFDRDSKILKLFTPPFVDGTKNPGYIKGYVAGIRENGGQYTHGAVWGASGLLAAGQTEHGWEVLSSLNPALRCFEDDAAEKYRIEPYVLAGDVYSNPAHNGRGGWSWYTGAAAWYYRVLLEQLLGFKKQADTFSVAPLIPDKWDGFTLKYSENSADYTIKVSRGTGRIILDGEPALFPIRITKGQHVLEVEI